MPLNPAPPVATQVPNQAFVLRRQMLVSVMFNYMEEIQEIKEGVAFKFCRSKLRDKLTL